MYLLTFLVWYVFTYISGVVCIYLNFWCDMYLLTFLVWYVFTYISGVVCIYLHFQCGMYLLTFLVWYVFSYISGVVCIYLHFQCGMYLLTFLMIFHRDHVIYICKKFHCSFMDEHWTKELQTVKERKLLQRNLSWQNYCGS